MKLKHSYNIFICYLTLAAFIAITGLNILARSKTKHYTTEFSTSNNGFNSSFSLLFEENETSDNLQYFVYSSFFLCVFSIFCFSVITSTLFACKITKKSTLLKTSLFINTKTMRI